MQNRSYYNHVANHIHNAQKWYKILIKFAELMMSVSIIGSLVVEPQYDEGFEQHGGSN